MNTINIGDITFSNQILDQNELSIKILSTDQTILDLSSYSTLTISKTPAFDKSLSTINNNVWITGGLKFHGAGKRTNLIPINKNNCKFKITTQGADQASPWILFSTDNEVVSEMSANQLEFLNIDKTTTLSVDEILSNKIVDFTEYFDKYPNLKAVLFNYYVKYDEKQVDPEFIQYFNEEKYQSINEFIETNNIKIDYRTKTTCGKYGVKDNEIEFNIDQNGVYLYNGNWYSSGGKHSQMFEINPNKCIFKVTSSIRDSVRLVTFFDSDLSVINVDRYYLNGSDDFDSGNKDYIDKECNFQYAIELNPNIKYVLFNWYPITNTTIEKPIVKCISIIDENTTLNDSIEYILSNSIDDISKNILENVLKSNVLYNKKYVTVGDSYTQYGPLPDQTYSHFIAERNNMVLNNIARSGAVTFIPESAQSTLSGRYNYSEHITDIYNAALTADYITFALGCNDYNDQSVMGLSTDSDNSTYFGAWNNILSATLSANPLIKIGFIINDGYITNKQYIHDTLVQVAEYWGIPYLDMCQNPQVPIMLNTGVVGRKNTLNPYAVSRRSEAMCNPSQTDHPGLEGQKYRSTIIENFLRSL